MHSSTVLTPVSAPKAAPPASHSVWRTSIRFTIVTTLLVGIGYPLLVTLLAGAIFPHKAAGSLILKDGVVIGSELLAQSFTSDRYFHPRPSAAGNGYDATSSGGSNLAQSNKTLV
ncbi:MAG: potassium-transporting ATPase subunit C, partial [Terracidiphilus sp.]